MWLKYSDEPILTGEQWDREQSGRLSEYEKPRGFWITDDSEDCWRSWCVGEGFALESLTHKHEVVLDERDILILRSPLDLDVFTRQYAVDRDHLLSPCIDWRRVAENHTGIIITPYQWQRRLHDGYSWYYTWDCASGCIWKASAIRDIRLIEVDMAMTERKAA